MNAFSVQPPRSKYGAKSVVIDGHRFASQKEARRYGELKLLECAGLIKDLRLQPSYDLNVNGVKIGRYVADFAYVERERPVTEDVKGVKTPVFKLKQKLLRALYGIEVRLT